ncbi:uncharacterized protein [Zea mays]|uniref:uncharacterized protein n=1 Tax=Zea mays TaxID=4577 RepID=UPI001651F8DB|nr:uncharacterized protein LOC118476805 [Zea mays]
MRVSFSRAVPCMHASHDSARSARVRGLTFYFFSAHNIFWVDEGRIGRPGPSYDEEPARRAPRSSPVWFGSGSSAKGVPQQGSHAWSSCPRSVAAPAPNPVSLFRFLGVVLAREARFVRILLASSLRTRPEHAPTTDQCLLSGSAGIEAPKFSHIIFFFWFMLAKYDLSPSDFDKFSNRNSKIFD